MSVFSFSFLSSFLELGFTKPRLLSVLAAFRRGTLLIHFRLVIFNCLLNMFVFLLVFLPQFFFSPYVQHILKLTIVAGRQKAVKEGMAFTPPPDILCEV